MLTLGAKEIIMNDDSYLGKIDPQNTSMLESKQMIIYHKLEEKYIDSRNIYMVLDAKYIINYTERLLDMIGLAPETRQLVESNLLYSELPHEALFNASECGQNIKLPVRSPIQEEECYFSDVRVKKYRKVVESGVSIGPIGCLILFAVTKYIS